MNPIKNFDSVELPSEHKRLTAGGYVCRITKAEDVADREYIRLEYDIAEGDLKGYWNDNEENYGWRDSFIRSYKDSAIRFFKAFTTAIEQSNSAYKWNWNEQTLVGKLVGLVLSEEEYEKRDGSIGTRLRVNRVTSIDNIRNGNYTVPAKKVIDTPQKPVVVDDDDLPFDV